MTSRGSERGRSRRVKTESSLVSVRTEYPWTRGTGRVRRLIVERMAGIVGLAGNCWVIHIFQMLAYMLTHTWSSRDIRTFISNKSSSLVIRFPILCKIVSHMTSYSRTFLLVHLPIFPTQHHMLTHYFHVLLIVWFLSWYKHGLCTNSRIVYIAK